MGNTLGGVIPVLHTSYKEDGSVNVEEFKSLIDWVYDRGAEGCCLAMVTDMLRLSRPEKIELMEIVSSQNRGRGVTIASVGAESTREAVDFARKAEALGFSAIMAIPPLSVNLGPAALEEYYGAIASAVDLPLIIQDASGYVGRSLDIRLYVEMGNKFGFDKILFKPEAEPLGTNLSALRDATSGKAKIFEGSGGISLVDGYRRGIAGTIPGCDLLEGVVALWKALREKDEKKIYEIYFPIAAIVALQLQAGLDGFLSVERYILHKKGVFTSDRMRPPYSWVPDDETKDEINRLLAILDRKLINNT